MFMMHKEKFCGEKRNIGLSVETEQNYFVNKKTTFRK